MGTEKHLHIVQAVKILMGDYLQATLRQTIHLIAIMDDVAKVASALRALFHPTKINYGAYGDTGCHLHFHLVPKYSNDPFEWGGTFAMDPKRTYLSDAEYEELVATIKAELTA